MNLFFSNFKFKKNNGFTLIELLIIVAILAILIIMSLTLVPQQLAKARDGERKSDLQKIKIAFENYHNDNGCYPPSTVLQNCGGSSPLEHELSPYLQDIPCDPKDESYYLYLPYDSTGGAGTCDGFRVWSKLEKTDDPVITSLSCNGATGCGAFAYFEAEIGNDAIGYNYGVSEGVPVLAGAFEEIINPGLENGYCCSGVCNVWSSGEGYCPDGPYVDVAECVAVSSCTN